MGGGEEIRGKEGGRRHTIKCKVFLTFMKSKERKAKLRRAIRLVWSSLDSHLPYLDEEPESKSDGTMRFQTQCAKEYGELIYILTQLL